MKDIDLSNYIINYLANDKTNSAIMLTGPWGSGKSYYINNILKKFLMEKGRVNDLIIVSLYGLKELDEISKSIYFEIRAKILNSRKETVTAGKIISKTIAKNLLGHIGIDFSISDKDLKKLYKSIDLKDKLVVLEDIERCSIDIRDILGFVNGLVENDNAKVLLVVNEDEIINYVVENKEDGNKQKLVKRYDNKTQEYFKIKEKTIGDTIKFLISPVNGIKNILNSFGNGVLRKVIGDTDDITDEIVRIMNQMNSLNLRAIKFACQKMTDLFDSIKEQFNHLFLRYVFLGIVAFSLKKKSEDNISWKDKTESSIELGTNKYPLQKFAYDYICFQKRDDEQIRLVHNDFCAKNEFAQKKNELNKTLDIIYNYWIYDEKTIRKEINQLINLLRINQDVPISECLKIVNYLIKIQEVINIKVELEQCKEIILNHLKNNEYQTASGINMFDSINLEADSQKEMIDFKERVYNINKEKQFDFFDSAYTREKVLEFCDKVINARDEIINKKSFANDIDIERFLQVITKCKSSEIYRIRQTFDYIYAFSNLSSVFKGDIVALEMLLDGLNNILNQGDSLEAIQKLQIKWFRGDLERILDKLAM